MIKLDNYWLAIGILLLVLVLSLVIIANMARRIRFYKRQRQHAEACTLPRYESIINMGPPPPFEKSLDASTHVQASLSVTKLA